MLKAILILALFPALANAKLGTVDLESMIEASSHILLVKVLELNILPVGGGHAELEIVKVIRGTQLRENEIFEYSWSSEIHDQVPGPTNSHQLIFVKSANKELVGSIYGRSLLPTQDFQPNVYPYIHIRFPKCVQYENGLGMILVNFGELVKLIRRFRTGEKLCIR